MRGREGPGVAPRPTTRAARRQRKAEREAAAAAGDPWAPRDWGAMGWAHSSWRDTGHACRRCGGQVQICGDLFRCSTCFVACHGDRDGLPSGICGCGLEINGRRFACVANPDRAVSPEMFIIVPLPETDRRGHPAGGGGNEGETTS
ncbi:MAG: hypothetical protein P4M00_24775 [Azospirillaceae bacterium]|nr:hypothetical protein [Azospirillaceae bacterium]